ncbi:MAG: AmmeMemoRadiSam system protein A, partial [Candidatus Latescibacterota bacterium]|nr:AmmeMemoRadiSam system protein A [Candidatus Latescibacterota bacterium]
GPTSSMSDLSSSDCNRLLMVAEQAIDHLLAEGVALQIDLSDYPASLHRQAATFVTLRREDRSLRGCMGSSIPMKPLVEDVADNTFAAATRDPRFPRLTHTERPGLQLSISVLSPVERMQVAGTADLIQQLRPGIDGLMLVDGSRRGTLLPAVWQAITDPQQFVTEVKAKAGWDADHWSETIAAFRYTAQSFGPS